MRVRELRFIKPNILFLYMYIYIFINIKLLNCFRKKKKIWRKRTPIERLNALNCNYVYIFLFFVLVVRFTFLTVEMFVLELVDLINYV